MRLYINPGSPQPPLEPSQSYLPPGGSLQQAQSTPASTPLPPQPSPKAALPRDHDPHSTLFDEWRRQHGDTWVRADDLAPSVRQLIDSKDRCAAIRQRLRQLVNTHCGLEAKGVDPRANRANRATLYRVVPQP